MSLNERQRSFVTAYMGEARGNATKAAEVAGYAPGSAHVTGARLLTNDKVRAAIDRLHSEDPKVAETGAIRRFWTEVMRTEGEDVRVRLKASELLAKASGMFLPTTEDTGPLCVHVVYEDT